MKRFLFIFIFGLSLFASDETYSLDYIYVNANTGQSSGGHSAIRVGSIVYHFQYFPDKIFHIIREPWENFRFIYGIQENRTIYISCIKLSKENYFFFLERLNEIYLYQKKELDNLEKLNNDLKILETMLKGDEYIFLKGAGYFSNSVRNPKSYVALHNKINTKLGENFILKKIISLRKKFNEFKVPENLELEINLHSNTYPKTIPNYSTDYIESLSFLKALEVLQEKFDLKKDGYFELASRNANNNILHRLSLSLSEKEDEIIQLLENDSNLSGYSLLVTLARYLVIRKSLEEKKIFFLNSFSKNNSLIVGEALENKTFLEGVEKQIFDKIENQITVMENLDKISERDYMIIEDLANRQKEIYDAISEKKAIRISYELLIPSKEEIILPYNSENTMREGEKNLKTYLENRDKYLLALQKKYPFNLFNRNCTTEIFRTLNSFQSGNNNILGSLIRENESFVFVPVYAYYIVGKKYNVKKELMVPSLRTLILKDSSNKKFIRRMKEISTLSSEYYRFNREDSLFIFFTDDMILTRPIFGIANLFAGLGELSFGLLISPFDGGEKIVKGLQGIFFSGPELIFFNIRKGTFIYEGNPDSFEDDESKKGSLKKEIVNQ